MEPTERGGQTDRHYPLWAIQLVLENIISVYTLLSFSSSNPFLMHLLSYNLPAEPPAESWQNSNKPSNTGQSSPTLTAKWKQNNNNWRGHIIRGGDLWTGSPLELWEYMNSMPNFCCFSDMVDSATWWGLYLMLTFSLMLDQQRWCPYSFYSHIPTTVCVVGLFPYLGLLHHYIISWIIPSWIP